jgi:hypothetical protein
MNHRILFFFFSLGKLGYRSLSLVSGSFTYTYMGEHSEEHSNLSCILGRNCIVPSVFLLLQRAAFNRRLARYNSLVETVVSHSSGCIVDSGVLDIILERWQSGAGPTGIML